jgi:hypothetical protein
MSITFSKNENENSGSNAPVGEIELSPAAEQGHFNLRILIEDMPLKNMKELMVLLSGHLQEIADETVKGNYTH